MLLKLWIMSSYITQNDALNALRIVNILWTLLWFREGHFVYAPSQWETTSQCDVVSHWLGACKNDPCFVYDSLKTNDRQFDNLIITGGVVSCNCGNSRCHWSRQNYQWYILFSVYCGTLHRYFSGLRHWQLANQTNYCSSGREVTLEDMGKIYMKYMANCSSIKNFGYI